MALWRDPLDDLIDELESSLPSDHYGGSASAEFEDLQAVMDAILYGGEEQQRRLKTMPQYERVMGQFRRAGLSV